MPMTTRSRCGGQRAVHHEESLLRVLHGSAGSMSKVVRSQGDLRWSARLG